MEQNNRIISTVVISVVTTLIVAGILAGIVVANKTRIAGYFQTANAPVQISATDSPIVNVVKKTNPAVVSIIITKNEPVVERYYSNTPFDFFGNLFNIPTPQ